MVNGYNFFKHNFFNVPIGHTDSKNSVPGRETVCHGHSGTAKLYPLTSVMMKLVIALVKAMRMVKGDGKAIALAKVARML